MNDINEAVKRLGQTLEDFFNQNLEEINWDEKQAIDKWSKKQIIGHLIDSAQVNLQRFVRCTYEANFKLIYQQEQWVKVQRYQETDIEDLLILWKLLNKQIIRLFEDYPQDRFDVQCDTGRDEPSLHTVSWLALDYVDHLHHHLKQIRA
ncbi:DinB family protein [Mucilaginibacter sp. X4EP1]|uniref:DinB family protein n=1 Tax=Mucilaginibacter sp. X4EP1 TaxID=2723092 RepID=UPI00216AA17E|nr:DinB family protein [Mucilaginibacter sp. X4EP1]MCS3815417.1 hypothetical protein [Mucilaginibacter sp. X4EP1]